MKYTYAYKTSDGVRHEESMDAESREVVFAALRERGIRAIKVVAADGSKANGEVHGIRRRVVVTLVAVVLLVGAAIGMFFGRSAAKDERVGVRVWKYTDDERRAFDALTREVDAMCGQHRASMEKLSLDSLIAEASTLATNEMSRMFKLVDAAHETIERTRKELKNVFSGISTNFPAGGLAIKDAQRLYGERMEALDAEAISMSNCRYAMALLDGYRDKWSLKDGQPVFSDPGLAQMYKHCLEGVLTDSSTARWKKDFGVISSEVIEIRKHSR